MVAITSFSVHVPDDQYGQDRYDGRDFVDIDYRVNLRQHRADAARGGCVRRYQGGIHGRTASDSRYRA